MKRTVLVLNHFAQPLTSPGGTRHVELFSKLDGWHARVLAADRNLLDGSRVFGNGIVETVRVTPYSGNGPARIANWVSYALTSLVRAIPARRVDLVYGSSPHLLAALTGWIVARVRRVPFVLEIRDIWPKVLVDMGSLTEASLTYRALHALERFLYRRADRVVILAEGSRAHLTLHGVDDQSIVFVPNGADAGDFRPSADHGELRQHYGFDGVVAVYAGAHGPANGLNLLLDAAAELAATAPDVQIVLVGDGAEKQRLEERVSREGLDRVRFIDPVPKTEIPDLLAAADIGLHCLADVELFRSAVSPNKLYDYMAAGLPVITNTPGEVATFVEQSTGGVAVAPLALAAGLETLAALSAEERAAMGARGRRHLEATRSRTAMARRIEALLDRLVPSTTRSGSTH